MGRTEEQLGQPHRHQDRVAVHRGERLDKSIAALLRGPEAARACSRTRSLSGTTEFGPHAVHAGSHGPRPQRRHVCDLAGRGGGEGRCVSYGASDEFSYQTAVGQDVLLRSTRHHPVPAGDRPRAVDVPPQRHRPSIDGRPRSRRARGPRVMVQKECFFRLNRTAGESAPPVLLGRRRFFLDAGARRQVSWTAGPLGAPTAAVHQFPGGGACNGCQSLTQGGVRRAASSSSWRIFALKPLQLVCAAGRTPPARRDICTSISRICFIRASSSSFSWRRLAFQLFTQGEQLLFPRGVSAVGRSCNSLMRWCNSRITSDFSSSKVSYSVTVSRKLSVLAPQPLELHLVERRGFPSERCPARQARHAGRRRRPSLSRRGRLVRFPGVQWLGRGGRRFIGRRPGVEVSIDPVLAEALRMQGGLAMLSASQ